MNPPDAVPPEVYQQFAGFKILTGFFGYWPSFHDAEVLRVVLEQRGRDRFEGPVLTMDIHTFGWGQQVDSGQTTFTHHCTVELRFTQVEALHLTDFNFQNVIFSLDFKLDHEESPPRVLVSFSPAHGVGGTFTCGMVEVVGVTPGIPPGSIYEK